MPQQKTMVVAVMVPSILRECGKSVEICLYHCDVTVFCHMFSILVHKASSKEGLAIHPCPPHAQGTLLLAGTRTIECLYVIFMKRNLNRAE